MCTPKCACLGKSLMVNFLSSSKKKKVHITYLLYFVLSILLSSLLNHILDTQFYSQFSTQFQTQLATQFITRFSTKNLQSNQQSMLDGTSVFFSKAKYLLVLLLHTLFLQPGSANSYQAQAGRQPAGVLVLSNSSTYTAHELHELRQRAVVVVPIASIIKNVCLSNK